MDKLSSTLTAVLICTLFSSAAFLHAMLNQNMQKPGLKNNPHEYCLYLTHNFNTRALEAEKYNNNSTLIILPYDVFNQIISYCHANDDTPEKKLVLSIKTFIQLSFVCKKFNRLLTFERIGKLCQHYPAQTKIQTFRRLIKPTYDPHHNIKYFPMLILLSAGIEANTEIELNNLLRQAVQSNNAELATTLFKYNANPHVQNDYGPVFFQCKTVAIAKLFIKNNVDVHMISSWPMTNVLWETIKNEYPSELMALYLDYQVDPKKLRPADNSSLLHKLATSNDSYKINNVDNFLKKATLLVNAIPDMINALDNINQTPLDTALVALKKSEKFGSPEVFKVLITLLKERGGKTARKLKKSLIKPSTD